MRYFFMVILVILLAACRSEPDPIPSGFDLNKTAIAQETNLAVTQQAIASSTPNIVRATATPIIDHPDFVGSVYPNGDWSGAALTDLEGSRRTLSDYAGQLIVLQTIAADCAVCQEQTQTIVEAVQNRAAFDDAGDIIITLLSVDATDTPAELEEYAAPYTTDPAITWITGQASQGLTQSLSGTFGQGAINPSAGMVIFIAPDGTAYLSSQAGLLAADQVEAMITYLRSPFSESAPTEEAGAGG